MRGLKELNIKTTHYDVGDGFRVMEVEDAAASAAWECYLYHKDYGTMILLFGGEQKPADPESVIMHNIDAFIAGYKEEIMDEV